MIVIDVLPFNDSISVGAVAVNDLTHPRKTLYDKSLTFVHSPYSVSDQKMTLISVNNMLQFRQCVRNVSVSLKTMRPTWIKPIKVIILIN